MTIYVNFYYFQFTVIHLRVLLETILNVIVVVLIETQT